MKIFVVAHKQFQMPISSKMYCTLWVGNAKKNLSKESACDDSGDNISEKNAYYNELSALYWIWKNTNEETVGLCHYRRYFTTLKGKMRNLLFGKNDVFLSEQYVEKKLKKYDVIVHNKTFFREGNRSQLVKSFYLDLKSGQGKTTGVSEKVMELLDETFRELYADKVGAYEKVMRARSAHLLNMIICKRKFLDEYCEWLFPLLFRLEEKLQRNDLYTERCMGLVAERLLDVWLVEKKVKYKECFSINTERIDWKPW